MKLSKNYLGLDISPTRVKLIELQKSIGKAELFTYGEAIYPHKIDIHDPKNTPEIREIINSLLKKTHAKSKHVFAALNTSNLILDYHQIPLDIAPDEFATKLKDSKFGSSLSNYLVETEFVRDNKYAHFTAVPRKEIKNYTEIFKNLPLNLHSLETENAAISRSLIGQDDSPLILIDFGASSTNITLIFWQQPLLQRTIEFGSNDITDFIVKKLKIKKEKADAFKKDINITDQDSPAIISEFIKILSNSINEIINKYIQEETKSIEKIVLTGGGSKIKGLPEYLEKTFKLKVSYGNTWARVLFSPELKELLVKKAPEYSVAAGLAMREIY